MTPKLLIGGKEASPKVNQVHCIYGTEAEGDWTVLLVNQPGSRTDLSRHAKERLFLPVQKHFLPPSSSPDLGRGESLEGKTAYFYSA